MPKAKIEFDLPEEQAEFQTTMNAGKYQSALWDITQWIRGQIKYTENETIEFEELRKKVWNIINENDITDL